MHVFYFKKHNFPTQIKLIFSQILTLAPDIKQYPIREKNRKKCRWKKNGREKAEKGQKSGLEKNIACEKIEKGLKIVLIMSFFFYGTIKLSVSGDV